jgi:hypothetical protein
MAESRVLRDLAHARPGVTKLGQRLQGRFRQFGAALGEFLDRPPRKSVQSLYRSRRHSHLQALR